MNPSESALFWWKGGLATAYNFDGLTETLENYFDKHQGPTMYTASIDEFFSRVYHGSTTEDDIMFRYLKHLNWGFDAAADTD